jgi:surface protein
MVSLHSNGVTIVARHSMEWYELNGWEHSLNGVEYHVVRNREALREQLRAKAFPERLVTTFVRRMHELFVDKRYFNGDVSAWDTSNVTDMTGMFHNAFAFNGDLSAWDTSNVTNMGDMFKGAYAFNGDLIAWDTSNVTDMSGMFYEAITFNGDLSKWNTSNVTNMSLMFYEAHVFNGDLSAWNTSNVTNMRSMFKRTAIRRSVPWCPDSKIVADQNVWKARLGIVARWRWALDCHRDASHCELAARYGRPMELAKRLRKGIRAGGLANARKGADNPHLGRLD